MDVDQVLHDLEQQHLLLKREHEALVVERDGLRAKITSSNGSALGLKELVASLESRLLDRERELQQKDGAVRELEISQEKLCRRVEEVDRLREEIRNQSDDILAIQTKLRDSKTSLAEAQGQMLPIQYELTQALREKDFVQERGNAAVAEVQKFQNEIANLNGQITKQAFESESLQRELRAELESRQAKINGMQDRALVQEEKLEQALNKVLDLETASVHQRALNEQEVDSLKRMTDLLQRHLLEATATGQDLENNLAAVKEAASKQVNHLRQQLQNQMEGAMQAMEEQRLTAEGRIAELQAAVLAQEQARGVVTILDDSEQSPSSRNQRPSSLPHEFGQLNLTEMYDKIVTLQRDFTQEQAARREAELFMNRIVKDVETKAPIIASQNRDYQRVTESHRQLSKKLDSVVTENARIRDALHCAEDTARNKTVDCTALEQHNKDLSKQLQHVLKKAGQAQFGLGGRKAQSSSVAIIAQGDEQSCASAGDVISDFLVTYDDVEELQTRNAQLLKVIRKLSDDQEKAQQQQQHFSSPQQGGQGQQSPGAGGALVVAGGNQFQAAVSELKAMREARQRSEELMTELVQQRDMYKAMVEESDSTLAVARRASDTSNSSASPAVAAGSRVQDLQWKLAQAEEEKTRLRERAARLEESDRLLSDRITAAKADCTTLRVDLARASSEARFNKERVDNLEAALKSADVERVSVVQRRLEMETLLLEHQKEARAKDESLRQLQDQLRQTKEALHRAEIAAEVAQASEARLVQHLAEQREETKRQVTLGDSVRRIEAGISSRAEEEKIALTTERDSLMKSLDALRKQVQDKSMIAEQRQESVADELRSVKVRLDDRIAEAASLREELARSQSLATASQERSSFLEKRLGLVEDRLQTAQGAQVLDHVLSDEIAQKDLQLEQNSATMDTLRQQLSIAENHVSQFQRISAANEVMLKELRERSSVTKQAHEAELQSVKDQLAHLQHEQTDLRQSCLLSLKEVETAQTQLTENEARHRESSASLQEETALAKLTAQKATEQLDFLKADVLRFQQLARSAHSNYEHELQLHAQAEKSLRETRDELELSSAALSSAQDKVTEVSARAICQEAALAEDKARLAAQQGESQAVMEELRRVNHLLHSQVQSLGVQVERLQTSRSADKTLSSASDASLTQADRSSLAAAAASDSSHSESETDKLLTEALTTVSELREVVRFMKRERDTLEAKLAVSSAEAAQWSSASAAAQRSLDEIKADLKREQDKKVSVRSEEEFSRLVAEVTQVNLLRQSNAHLAYENKELSTKLSTLTEEVKALKTAHAPLEDRIRLVTAEKEAALCTCDHAVKDASDWKERYVNIIGRLHAVDPEEHRLLQVKCDTATAELTTITASAAATQAQIQELEGKSTAAAEEVASLTTRCKNSEDYTVKMRNTARDMKTRLEALQQAKIRGEAELKEQLRVQQEQCKTVQDQLAEAMAAKEVATGALASAATAVAPTVSDTASAVSVAAPISAPIVLSSVPVSESVTVTHTVTATVTSSQPAPPPGPPPALLTMGSEPASSSVMSEEAVIVAMGSEPVTAAAAVVSISSGVTKRNREESAPAPSEASLKQKLLMKKTMSVTAVSASKPQEAPTEGAGAESEVLITTVSSSSSSSSSGSTVPPPKRSKAAADTLTAPAEPSSSSSSSSSSETEDTVTVTMSGEDKDSMTVTSSEQQQQQQDVTAVTMTSTSDGGDSTAGEGAMTGDGDDEGEHEHEQEQEEHMEQLEADEDNDNDSSMVTAEGEPTATTTSATTSSATTSSATTSSATTSSATTSSATTSSATSSATTSSATSSATASKEAPATTPFLSIRPPSPSSATVRSTVIPVFGFGGNKGALPMPSLLTPGTSTTPMFGQSSSSSSTPTLLLPLTQPGNSLFKSVLATATATASTSASTSVPSTGSSSSLSGLAGVFSGSSGSSGSLTFGTGRPTTTFGSVAQNKSIFGLPFGAPAVSAPLRSALTPTQTFPSTLTFASPPPVTVPVPAADHNEEVSECAQEQATAAGSAEEGEEDEMEGAGASEEDHQEPAEAHNKALDLPFSSPTPAIVTAPVTVAVTGAPKLGALSADKLLNRKQRFAMAGAAALAAAASASASAVTPSTTAVPIAAAAGMRTSPGRGRGAGAGRVGTAGRGKVLRGGRKGGRGGDAQSNDAGAGAQGSDSQQS